MQPEEKNAIYMLDDVDQSTEDIRFDDDTHDRYVPVVYRRFLLRNFIDTPPISGLSYEQYTMGQLDVELS